MAGAWRCVSLKMWFPGGHWVLDGIHQGTSMTCFLAGTSCFMGLAIALSNQGFLWRRGFQGCSLFWITEVAGSHRGSCDLVFSRLNSLRITVRGGSEALTREIGCTLHRQREALKTNACSLHRLSALGLLAANQRQTTTETTWRLLSI